MPKDKQQLSIDMNDDRIIDLARAAIRINQYTAGILRDMHREQEALDFLQSIVLLAASAVHTQLSSVCDCDRCLGEQLKLSSVVSARVIDLLAAFAEQQNKEGK